MKKIEIILLISITSLIFITVTISNYSNDDNGIDKSNYTKKNKNNQINKEIKEIGTWRYGSTIENGSLRLNNNVWGLTNEERKTKRVKSYIYYKFNGNFGWEWDRPDPRNGLDVYIPPIYPEVTIGTAPYVNSPDSTTPYLPIKLKNVRSMTAEVKYKYIKSPTGAFNLAYDIWFVDDIGTKKAEIMIWPYGGLNVDLPDGKISDGMNEYEYYYRPPGDSVIQKWDYHSFILKDQDPVPLNYLNYKVNIKILFDELIRSGKLNSEWTIPSMSIGNEVWRGSGKIEISKLIININGNII